MRIDAAQGAAGVVAHHRCVCFFKQTNAESSELFDLKNHFRGKEASTGFPDQIGQTCPVNLPRMRASLPVASMARYKRVLWLSYLTPTPRGLLAREVALMKTATWRLIGLGLAGGMVLAAAVGTRR